MTLVSLECEWCGVDFEKKKKEYNRQLRQGRDYFFCGLSCGAKHRNRSQTEDKERQARNNPIKWSFDIAYLTGLIVSDGTLHRKKPRIGFTNSEFELIEYVRDIVESEITGKTYKPIKSSRDGSVWWNYRFTSRRYYYFLQDIGLTPNKSLSITELDIPDQYFADFLRGEIDGDGGFNEWLTNFQCSIASGSKEFLLWLLDKTKELIEVNGGWIREGDNVYELGFAINDSIKIAEYIYYADRPKLARKYRVVEKYLQ
jgi:YHS domain-containing protein